MKVTEIILEAKTPEAPKPRNFVAKHAKTGGAGAHKNKKKAAKQGDVKHKGKVMAEDADELYGLRIGDTVTARIDGRRVQGDIIDIFPDDMEVELFLRGPEAGRTVVVDVRDTEIVEDQGVQEGSDFGEPREILEDVLQTLERQVEWPLTDVMDPREVKQLLAPLVKAVNDKMMSMDEAQDDWGSMSHSEFKRKELQHELGHEDDPEFQRQMREKDRGPWYIKIDGRIYKQKGQPKAFDWKKGANNYALAMLKNKPELKTKTVLTRKPVDDVVETATIASTSAGNVTVGAVYPNKKGKTPKNKDGTAKNALDMSANLLTGGSIRRR